MDCQINMLQNERLYCGWLVTCANCYPDFLGFWSNGSSCPAAFLYKGTNNLFEYGWFLFRKCLGPPSLSHLLGKFAHSSFPPFYVDRWITSTQASFNLLSTLRGGLISFEPILMIFLVTDVWLWRAGLAFWMIHEHVVTVRYCLSMF